MNALVPIASVVDAIAVQQTDPDLELIQVWLDRYESKHTRRNYERHARSFCRFVGKPIVNVRLVDVQAYLSTFVDKAPATRANATDCIKSLLSFAQETGYTQFNVGKVVKAPTVKNTLAERIMTEADAVRMIALEPNPRNRALLTLVYGAGLRISEACALRRRDLIARDRAGQATIYGKGGKTRMVLLSENTWRELQAIGENANPDAPVFPSRESAGHLDPSQVHRIIKAAAARAGLPPAVSTHWLRHAHASHSLDRGAPIHLVQATLGHASVATTGRYLHARPTDSSARYLGV